jgi:hypothetical protein
VITTVVRSSLGRPIGGAKAGKCDMTKRTAQHRPDSCVSLTGANSLAALNRCHFGFGRVGWHASDMLNAASADDPPAAEWACGRLLSH